MEVCSDCGAIIDGNSRTIHEWHHEKLNAVYDSVEAILKVMPKKAPTKETE